MNKVFQDTIKLQQLASDPKNSAWVFASAGSGKTKILVSRVLRLLLSGTHPSKILCLTYTKIAANEMQNRIYQELSKWLLLPEKELIKVLEDLSGKDFSQKELAKELTIARTLLIKILDQESALKVQTIHSFCQDLMKAFPFESKIKPNFTIIDEQQEKLLLIKARKNILNQALKNQQLKSIISSISAKLGEDSFINLIGLMLEKKERLIFLKQKYFTIENITDEIFKNLKIGKNQNKEIIFSAFLEKIKKHFSSLQELVMTLENSDKKTDITTKENLQKFLSNPKLENFSLYQSTFFTNQNQPKKLIITAKYNQEKFLDLFAIQQELILEFLDQLNSLEIANSTAEILEISDKILGEYLRLKDINSYLDYNDLIIKTNQLLLNPEFEQWIKYKMDGFFDHILIDESQDTNDLGWNIIKAISEDFFSGENYQDNSQKNRTIFIVGDQKQSIFSFQGAKPNICEEIYDYFAKKLSDLGSKLYKINLDNSFRSNQTILEIIDGIFLNKDHRLAIKASEEFNGHNAIRKGIGRFELWPEISAKKILKKQDTDQLKIDFTPKQYYQEKEFLAEIIALKIQDWIQNQRIIDAKNRKVQYSDIMILLRNRTNGFDKILGKFFNKYSIPFSSNSKIEVGNNIIICDFLSLAKFTLFKNDDLNMAGLLKSPFFNFEEEELFEVCQIKNQQNISLFEALKSRQASKNSKYVKTVNQLEQYIAKSKESGVYGFFYYVANHSDNYQKILSRFGAKSIQLQEIIEQFLLIAFNFENKFSLNLLEFLDYIEKLLPKIAINNRDQNQDKIVITTVHSAKGLQSPIIIIPDTIYNFDLMPNSREKIFWIDCFDDNLPFFVNKSEERNNFIKFFQKQKIQESKDEYLRLLYVATSRAEDELYVAGFKNNSKTTRDQNCWYSIIADSLDNKFDVSSSVKSKYFDQEFLPANIKDQLLKQDLSKNFEQIFDFNHQIIAYGSKTNNIKSDILLPSLKTNDLNSNLVATINASINQEHKTLDIKAKYFTQKSAVKGEIIHKALEIIGKISSFYNKNRIKADKTYLLNIATKIIKQKSLEAALDYNLTKEIISKIEDFINSDIFDDLFSNNLECEIEISGYFDKKLITKRIDLLVIKENEIIIIDYKSDDIAYKDLQNPAPQDYQQQLNIYQNLLAKIYPNYKIGTAILWIKFLQLIKIN